MSHEWLRLLRERSVCFLPRFGRRQSSTRSLSPPQCAARSDGPVCRISDGAERAEPCGRNHQELERDQPPLLSHGARLLCSFHCHAPPRPSSRTTSAMSEVRSVAIGQTEEKQLPPSQSCRHPEDPQVAKPIQHHKHPNRPSPICTGLRRESSASLDPLSHTLSTPATTDPSALDASAAGIIRFAFWRQEMNIRSFSSSDNRRHSRYLSCVRLGEPRNVRFCQSKQVFLRTVADCAKGDIGAAMAMGSDSFATPRHRSFDTSRQNPCSSELFVLFVSLSLRLVLSPLEEEPRTRKSSIVGSR